MRELRNADTVVAFWGHLEIWNLSLLLPDDSQLSEDLNEEHHMLLHGIKIPRGHTSACHQAHLQDSLFPMGQTQGDILLPPPGFSTECA